MRKPELQRHADAMAEAIGALLLVLREGARCLMCGEQNGVPHAPTCGAWHVITARAGYHMRQHAEECVGDADEPAA